MSARLKIVHRCPNAPALDVLIDHHLVGANTVFQQSTEYREYAPGPHDIVFRQAGSPEPLLGPLSLMLTDHESYTLFIDCPKSPQAPISVGLHNDVWVRPTM